ncbi:hypothetical protein DUNSADRAFT_1624 [Dunaliella salina]|uniref:Encoded protein n=1 Tax=Dunaliella salina TaxID=3046 RepID=A0ABQ7H8L1_DUNSA|nr:hypothetical protein DUNSADRAFT_1624 [Dunaliella salina]|eukprot:KAF5843197.1 hypothetical protein DUNSADRAFT_1624 [Dunaliella salina]
MTLRGRGLQTGLHEPTLAGATVFLDPLFRIPRTGSIRKNHVIPERQGAKHKAGMLGQILACATVCLDPSSCDPLVLTRQNKPPHP